MKFDPSSESDHDKLEALIKPAVAQVANAGGLTAGMVCRVVLIELRKIIGDSAKFSASYHHVCAWKFYNIRPAKNAKDPRKTKIEHCQYDDAHRDYVYTEAWRDFLIKEIRKPGQLDRILDKSKNA